MVVLHPFLRMNQPALNFLRHIFCFHVLVWKHWPQQLGWFIPQKEENLSILVCIFSLKRIRFRIKSKWWEKTGPFFICFLIPNIKAIFSLPHATAKAKFHGHCPALEVFLLVSPFIIREQPEMPRLNLDKWKKRAVKIRTLALLWRWIKCGMTHPVSFLLSLLVWGWFRCN